MEEFLKTYTITVNDLDRYDRIKPSTYLDLSQDLASNHADLLHIGFLDLIKKDLIWVVVRTKVEIFDFKKNISLIKGRTFPLKNRFVEAPRDYEFYDEKGHLISKGESSWLVLNYKENKLVSLDLKINENESSVFNERIKKLNKIERNEDNFIKNITVSNTMIDHNNHLNNIHAMDIFLDAISLKENEVITSFQIEYLSQAFKDDVLSIYLYKNENIYSLYAYKEKELKFYLEVKVNEY